MNSKQPRCARVASELRSRANLRLLEYNTGVHESLAKCLRIDAWQEPLEKRGVWRIAQPADDDSVVEMCLRLYSEDPGPLPIAVEKIRTTLAVLRRDPRRGRAVVLDIHGQILGYALLVRFWSNEFGGDVCGVDELFVVPEHRNQGYGSSLFAAIAQGDLWAPPIPAIALGITQNNTSARRLYERLGFEAVGIVMVRRLRQGSENLP